MMGEMRVQLTRKNPPSEWNNLVDNIFFFDYSRWKHLDVPVGQESNETVQQIVPGLKPATRYAIYIHTYSIASRAGSEGGLSDIQYVTTSTQR
jgi:hypothetical protein